MLGFSSSARATLMLAQLLNETFEVASVLDCPSVMEDLDTSFFQVRNAIRASLTLGEVKAVCEKAGDVEAVDARDLLQLSTPWPLLHASQSRWRRLIRTLCTLVASSYSRRTL